MYSNQVIARDVPGLDIKSEIPLLEKKGFLQTQVFVPDRLRNVNPHNALEAGRSLALTTCSNCHSLSSTGMRPLANYFGGNTDVAMVQTYLQGALGTGNTIYMPHIPLNDDEAYALARFIVSLNPSPQPVVRTAAAPEKE